MSFTPAFQAILTQCQKLNESKEPQSKIREYFYQSVSQLTPFERINNLYRIRPKRPVVGQASRLQFFSANLAQSTFWKNHTNRDLILKMRQGGVTTFSCLIALDLCLWNFGVNTAIMAHVRDNVQKFFRITKTAFTQFQKDWGDLYPVRNAIDNVSELQIAETGSFLSVCTEAKGLTLDFLHISEAAFIEDARISESLEAVPLSGWVIMETTPDTASGYFYDLWTASSENPLASFKNHFFPWWYHYPEPEDYPRLTALPDFSYTEKEEMLVKTHDLTKEHIIWRRLKISEAGGDEGEFMRKYPEDPTTCFLSGSRSVFSADVISSLWRQKRKPAFLGDLQLAA